MNKKFVWLVMMVVLAVLSIGNISIASEEPKDDAVTAVVLPGGITAAVAPDEEVGDVAVGDYGWYCALVQEEAIHYCPSDCVGYFVIWFERWKCLPGEPEDFCENSPMEILRWAECIGDPINCDIGDWNSAYDNACR